MAQKRTSAELGIYDGEYRSFEWFWAGSGAMPGLDAYKELAERDKDDFLASVTHWGTISAGGRPLQTRVNVEHHDPIIVAIKAGKNRFSAFKEEHGPTWIVYGHYIKKGQKRDTQGDRIIKATLSARADYFKRVNEATYYERD